MMASDSHSHKSSGGSCSHSLSHPRSIYGIPDIFSHPDSLISRPMIDLRTPESIQKDTCLAVINLDSDSFDYMCRICHEGGSFEELLNPCKCKGSIALAHLKCLETWLIESNRNECELCQYHYRIVREPKYSVLWSILVFIRHPGDHLREMLLDFFTFVIYTPSTVTSTYMLLLLCEAIARTSAESRRSLASHVVSFTAIFGIAAINFIYTSWLALTLEKYVGYWKEWYKKNSSLKVILSNRQLAVTKLPIAT